MTQEEAWLLREKYAGEKTEGFFADCDRLALGEPVAYLIGHTPFLNTTIHLDSKPLIPRTETEFWVEQIIKNMASAYEGSAFVRVLDLCAGSGCIGVAVLKNVQNATVDFAEIDGSHHTTIQKNIHENEIVISRTNTFGGDLFENIRETYDYILTNPPYIDPVENQTEASVKQYEPARALYADQHGLEIIFRIIDEAPRFLKPQGVLVIEHDPEQSEAIAQEAERNGLKAETRPDQFGVLRYTYCVRKDTTTMA